MWKILCFILCLSCSLRILCILYHFKIVNHDVHILKAFSYHLLLTWLTDAIDLLWSFSSSSLAKCNMGFLNFFGLQEFSMNNTFFLKKQLLKMEFCSVDRVRRCTREDNSEEENDLQVRRNISAQFIIWWWGKEARDQKCWVTK